MQHLSPHAVDDSEGDFSPVLRRIDMSTERAFAKRPVHDLYDRIRHRARIGIRRDDGGEGFLDLLP